MKEKKEKTIVLSKKAKTLLGKIQANPITSLTLCFGSFKEPSNKQAFAMFQSATGKKPCKREIQRLIGETRDILNSVNQAQYLLGGKLNGVRAFASGKSQISTEGTPFGDIIAFEMQRVVALAKASVQKGESPEVIRDPRTGEFNFNLARMVCKSLGLSLEKGAKRTADAYKALIDAAVLVNVTAESQAA